MWCLSLGIYVAGACLWLLVSSYAWAEHHGKRRGEETDRTRALRVVTAPLWFAWIAYWLVLGVHRLAVDLSGDSEDVDLLGAVCEGGWRNVTRDEMKNLRCSVKACNAAVIAYRPLTCEALCFVHLELKVNELLKNSEMNGGTR